MTGDFDPITHTNIELALEKIEEILDVLEPGGIPNLEWIRKEIQEIKNILNK